jgi:hypothetical protein
VPTIEQEYMKRTTLFVVCGSGTNYLPHRKRKKTKGEERAVLADRGGGGWSRSNDSMKARSSFLIIVPWYKPIFVLVG